MRRGQKQPRARCVPAAHDDPYRYYPKMEGEGLLQNIKEWHLSRLKSRPRKLNQFMKERGGLRITQVDVCRTPVKSAIQKAVQFFSGKSIEEFKKRYNYDDLFHLYMVLHLTDGTKWLFEKNEVVRIVPPPKPSKDTRCESRKVRNVEFNGVIKRAESDYPNLYYYNASSDNCQKFVKHIINKMGVRDLDDFVMQYDINKLIKGGTRGFAHFLTTMAASFKRYILGAGEEKTSSNTIE